MLMQKLCIPASVKKFLKFHLVKILKTTAPIHSPTHQYLSAFLGLTNNYNQNN